MSTQHGEPLTDPMTEAGRNFMEWAYLDPPPAWLDEIRADIVAIEQQAVALERERIRAVLWPASDLVPVGDCCEGNSDDAHYHGRERGYELARRDVLALLEGAP